MGWDGDGDGYGLIVGWMGKEGTDAHTHSIRSMHTHVLGSGEHQHRHRQITLQPTRSSPWISLSYFSSIVIVTHTHFLTSFPSFFSCCFLFQAVSFYISFHSSLYFLNVSTAHGCYYKRPFLLFYYLSLQGHHHPLQVPPSSRPSFPSLLQLFTSLPNLIRIQIPHTLSDQALFNVVPHSLFFLLICLLPFNFPFLSLSLYKWRNLGLLWTNSKRMNVLPLFN